MEAATFDREQAKQLVKEVLLEMLQDRHSALYTLLVEALEDVALARAIEEGREGKYVTKEALVRLLQE